MDPLPGRSLGKERNKTIPWVGLGAARTYWGEEVEEAATGGQACGRGRKQGRLCFQEQDGLHILKALKFQGREHRLYLWPPGPRASYFLRKSLPGWGRWVGNVSKEEISELVMEGAGEQKGEAKA